MSLRRISTVMVEGSPVVARVFRDQDSREFVVRLYEGGKHYEPADYFTDDREDAEGTALLMVQHRLH